MTTSCNAAWRRRFFSLAVVAGWLHNPGKSRPNSNSRAFLRSHRFQGLIKLSQLSVQFCHARQGHVPPALQFPCNQPIRRIGQIVLTSSAVNLESRLLDGQGQRLALLSPLVTELLQGV